ncbi:MAG: hypothetical protein GX094_08390 [Clostridiales bacterium]|jgi:hypothetical protein|nr:hypothetical protein [Clostridiales bacterium]
MADIELFSNSLINVFRKHKYRLKVAGILAVLIAVVFLCTSRMNYKNAGDVSFGSDDPSYSKVMEEKDYKIVNQSLIGSSITFTPEMFPEEYVMAYESDDIDWKIPLFTCENTTVYLKCIVQSNESPDYLYAIFYFIHDIGKTPGNILTVGKVNFKDELPDSYTPTANVKRDVFSLSLDTTIEDAVSLRGTGPGSQMAIYLKRSVVEQTKGDFTVELESLNLISYVPKSQYIPLDEEKKKRIRDMVYNELIDSGVNGRADKLGLTGEEEIYAAVAFKGQQVIEPYENKLMDVSGRYMYYVSFHTEMDGLLGSITVLVDPKSEKITGVFPRY